ncbi:MAG: NAD(P)H-hydrate epimerase [Candidatus Peregrinibacteria bacterium]|nr:NAD(P)H-hydrate epimerase [Candidatus Peregrinibacteria bacterium]
MCGKGHNGGDSLAAARHLKNWGYNVNVLLAQPHEELKETSKHHYNLLKQMKVPMKVWKGTSLQKKWFKQSTVIIDGLLGYNIKGNPRPPFDTLINLANETSKPILAIDLPSGLNGSTGKRANPCIRADSTLTLALPKTGLMEPSAKEYVGKVYVADLGIPDFIFKKAGIKLSGPIYQKHSISLT